MISILHLVPLEHFTLFVQSLGLSLYARIKFMQKRTKLLSAAQCNYFFFLIDLCLHILLYLPFSTFHQSLKAKKDLLLLNKKKIVPNKYLAMTAPALVGFSPPLIKKKVFGFQAFFKSKICSMLILFLIICSLVPSELFINK